MGTELFIIGCDVHHGNTHKLKLKLHWRDDASREETMIFRASQAVSESAGICHIAIQAIVSMSGR